MVKMGSLNVRHQAIFLTTLLVYRSAIYPQGMTFKYGLGGWLCMVKIGSLNVRHQAIFLTTLLLYRSAIYPQGMTFKYGLGGRLAER